MIETIVAIPFYRNAEFAANVLRSLGACNDELAALGAEVILIVDSPDDQELIDTLQFNCQKYLDKIPYDIVLNESNIGFIRSINIAMERSVQTKNDIIILNSDVEIFPGALSEMRAVAYSDHMIAFVSPRSNNATICSLPWDDRLRHRTPARSYEDFRLLRPMLHRVAYVPTVVGFAMFIKSSVLADLGLFDEIYGLGYNEENDLIMRANRRGYVAAIANWAFVYHVGEGSFRQLDQDRHPREVSNRQILDGRYPEYARAIDSYFKSPAFHAYRLIDSLLPSPNGKFNIGFDLSSFKLFHNGTFRAGKKILESFLRHFGECYNIFAICQEDVFTFHDLASFGNIICIGLDEPMPLTAIIRFGQPFSAPELTALRYRSPLLAILMLDTIALDCLYLNNGSLHALWQSAIDMSDRIFVNSRYTDHQIRQRFEFDDPARLILLPHSTDITEYEGMVSNSAQRTVLLNGNGFHHKAIQETLSFIRALGSGYKVIVFGIDGPSDEQFEFVVSGPLTEHEVDQLYARCSIVLFPSHYEGFGFPILDALRRGKPVVARLMPVYEEIAATCGQSANIHLFSTTKAMVAAALSGQIEWIDTPSNQIIEPIRWEQSANGIDTFVMAAIAEVTHKGLERKLASAGRFSELDHLALTRLLSQSLTVMEAKISRICNRIRGAWTPRGRLRAEVELLRTSPFFDPTYYLGRYTDVAKRGVDPARHFAEFGWREGRDPSPYFDIAFYKQTHRDFMETDTNPLVHFHARGVYEGRDIQTADGAIRMRLTVTPASGPLRRMLEAAVDRVTF